MWNAEFHISLPHMYESVACKLMGFSMVVRSAFSHQANWKGNPIFSHCTSYTAQTLNIILFREMKTCMHTYTHISHVITPSHIRLFYFPIEIVFTAHTHSHAWKQWEARDIFIYKKLLFSRFYYVMLLSCSHILQPHSSSLCVYNSSRGPESKKRKDYVDDDNASNNTNNNNNSRHWSFSPCQNSEKGKMFNKCRIGTCIGRVRHTTSTIICRHACPVRIAHIRISISAPKQWANPTRATTELFTQEKKIERLRREWWRRWHTNTHIAWNMYENVKSPTAIAARNEPKSWWLSVCS